MRLHAKVALVAITATAVLMSGATVASAQSALATSGGGQRQAAPAAAPIAAGRNALSSTSPIPPTITLLGHTYSTSVILSAKKYISQPAKHLVVSPGIKALPNTTVQTVERFVADVNIIVNSEKAGPLTSAPTTSGDAAQALAAACPPHVFMRGATIVLQFPNCMLGSAAAIVGGLGGLLGMLTRLGVAAATATAIVTYLGGAVALIGAWYGICAIVGPGNGVEYQSSSGSNRWGCF
jgi:hypothetical protein